MFNINDFQRNFWYLTAILIIFLYKKSNFMVKKILYRKNLQKYYFLCDFFAFLFDFACFINSSATFSS